MTSDKHPVRVRFAPSPTGHVHLGSARTALYNYLIARHTGGEFLLRIEDSDRRRFVVDAEQELIDGLHWLGIQWDEGPDVGGSFGPYRQSERKEIYQDYAQQLIQMGKAYYCFCTTQDLERVRQEQQKNKEAVMYSGICRNLAREEVNRRIEAGEPHVVRFRTPRQGTTTVTDLLRGEISVDNRTIDDYVLVRSDGLALYHLAAMVDDHLMTITHVLRGSEWLPTFPLHALILRAFGWEEPTFVHLSVFLKPSGKGKMSKREAAELPKDGHSIFLKDLQGLGYIPEAVNNWVSLMGWSYDDRAEFFSMEDLIAKFSLESLNPSPAAINFSKLDHFNGIHIRNLQNEDLAKRVKPFFEEAGYEVEDKRLLKIIPLIQERLGTLAEAPEIAGFFFKDHIEPQPTELIGKGMIAEQSALVVQRSYKVLSMLPNLEPSIVEPPMRELVDDLGLTAGQVFGILRVAVTGQRVSPPLFESMHIIGLEIVLERIQHAYLILKGLATAEKSAN